MTEEQENLLRQTLSEMESLRKEVAQINKALAYKNDKVKNQEKGSSLKDKLMMDYLMKARQIKRS